MITYANVEVLAAVSTVLGDGPWGRHHDGWDGGGWWLWGFSMMVFWIAVMALVVWLLARRGSPGPTPHDSARAILAERYARGEITTEEYHERLDALR